MSRLTRRREGAVELLPAPVRKRFAPGGGVRTIVGSGLGLLTLLIVFDVIADRLMKAPDDVTPLTADPEAYRAADQGYDDDSGKPPQETADTPGNTGS